MTGWKTDKTLTLKAQRLHPCSLDEINKVHIQLLIITYSPKSAEKVKYANKPLLPEIHIYRQFLSAF